ALYFAIGCVVALKRSPPAVLLAGACLGLLGGFRPTDVVFLTPAFLWTLGCVWRRERNPRLVLGAAGLAVGLTLGWLAPTLANTGGLDGYLQSLRDQGHLLSRTSTFLGGWPAFLDARFTAARSLWSLLGAAWLPAALGLAAWGYSAARGRERGSGASPAILGLLIVAPAFLFYLLVHFNSPGYTLTYAGYLAAVGAALGSRLLPPFRREDTKASPGRESAIALAFVIGLIVIGNGTLFLRGWPGAMKFGQRSLSAAELRDHDRYYGEVDAFLRRNHPSEPVHLLCSWTATDGLRVVQTLLPERASDISQAVAHHPELPAAFGSLSWLRLVTPAEVRAGDRCGSLGEWEYGSGRRR
ncbi:MAG: hypothetical protein K0Q72_4263, partial [Armatimonadetes bacterium]|nr:hypothetical protein [Armatimonadota bacterium]